MVNCLIYMFSVMLLSFIASMVLIDNGASLVNESIPDLQLVCISRTPRFPRYDPIYTYYEITEPSGFGPYIFSAATDLGKGQNKDTRRWFNIGDTVTYTATIRNRGDNVWDDEISGNWTVDGIVFKQVSRKMTLKPGDKATFEFTLDWDNQSHDISFTLDITDARKNNNQLSINTKSVPFLSYIDISYMKAFKEETANYPNAVTDDFIDWLNNHIARFNKMFADANCLKRVHYDILDVLADGDSDPDIDTQPFAIFPFRFRAGEGSLRLSGYYNPDDDIDYGLLHEMAHQLGLIDIYQLDLAPENNHVSNLGYSAVECLMRVCSPFLSKHSALGMNHWLDKAHGYYGQYMYCIPSQIKIRFIGNDGNPIKGAAVKMYQYCERPGLGKVITDQIKAQGITDNNGEYVLPNVPIDKAKVPPTYAGDELKDNPFGYLAVVGTNGVLHFQVEYNGKVDYAWLDITEVNVAYFSGQTDVAKFERQIFIDKSVQSIQPGN